MEIKLRFEDQLKSERLLYFNEGIHPLFQSFRHQMKFTPIVVKERWEADTSERSMMLQRMMGHLPMLFHPDPQRVVNIGLGAGADVWGSKLLSSGAFGGG